METNIGKKVIIRGDRSGVEYGTLVAQNGQEVTLQTLVEYGTGTEQHLFHSSP